MYYFADIAHLYMHVNYGITFCHLVFYLNCLGIYCLVQFLHGLPRYVSAWEQQVLNNIITFDAILRKMSCSFVYHYYESKSKLISLIALECFINSSYYKLVFFNLFLFATHF